MLCRTFAHAIALFKRTPASCNSIHHISLGPGLGIHPMFHCIFRDDTSITHLTSSDARLQTPVAGLGDTSRGHNNLLRIKTTWGYRFDGTVNEAAHTQFLRLSVSRESLWLISAPTTAPTGCIWSDDGCTWSGLLCTTVQLSYRVRR